MTARTLEARMRGMEQDSQQLTSFDPAPVLWPPMPS
jgi:hypothetical protein